MNKTMVMAYHHATEEKGKIYIANRFEKTREQRLAFIQEENWHL